jgi:hypothetical protein
VWRVRLSDSDLLLLHEVTSKRCSTKSAHSVASQKHDRARTDWDICYFGFMGEVGVARALCIDPDWSVLIGGDSGFDLSLGGITCQVKTPISRQTKDWLYFNSAEKLTSRAGILCNIDEYETSVIIRGVVLRQDFFSGCVAKDFGYGERIALHVSHMRSMDDLIAAVQESKQQKVGERC